MTIAIVFLFLCLLIIRLLSTLEQDLVNTMLSEGLTIIGWVAMWEPVYVFLYGWWPIVQKRNIYRKILSKDISVISGSQCEVILPNSCFSPNISELRFEGPKFTE